MKKKRKKRVKKWKNLLLIGLIVFIWYTETFSYMATQPRDISGGLTMLLFPLIFGIFHRRFRTFIFRPITLIIKLFRYKSMLPVDLREIDDMDGLSFERFLKPVFERQGYVAEVTQGSGDYGADLVLRKGGRKYVVQAKRYSSNIGVAAVQQVVAAVKYYEANGAIVVTNQFFTAAAVELAHANKVRLIDRNELSRVL